MDNFLLKKNWIFHCLILGRIITVCAFRKSVVMSFRFTTTGNIWQVFTSHWGRLPGNTDKFNLDLHRSSWLVSEVFWCFQMEEYVSQHTRKFLLLIQWMGHFFTRYIAIIYIPIFIRAVAASSNGNQQKLAICTFPMKVSVYDVPFGPPEITSFLPLTDIASDEEHREVFV